MEYRDEKIQSKMPEIFTPSAYEDDKFKLHT